MINVCFVGIQLSLQVVASVVLAAFVIDELPMPPALRLINGSTFQKKDERVGQQPQKDIIGRREGGRKGGRGRERLKS